MVSSSCIPTEVMYNILSFLPYPEVYRLRSVSRKFQAMAEHHIYQKIRCQGQTITINLGEKKNVTIELEAVHYDALNKVIEFAPMNNKNLVTLSDNNVKTKAANNINDNKRQQGSSWSTSHRLFQVQFSQWHSENKMDARLEQCLDQKERALFEYHECYNPAMEKSYELPCWNRFNNTEEKGHYVGDKGMIFHFAYVDHSSQQEKSYEQALLGKNPFYGYHSIISSPAPSAPVMEVKWLRVTFDWLLTGMKSMVPSSQIYQTSYNKLDMNLKKAGGHCIKYNPFSETLLDYIIRDQDEKEDLTNSNKELIQYIYSHSHECHTRLSRLERMLEGAGVDAQVLWKYTFARLFVVGSGSLIGEEYIVRRIQDAEEEWRLQKLRFSRRLLSVTV